MAGKRSDKTVRLAAVEICHSQLRVAVATKQDHETIRVETRTIQWRQQASSLIADEGPAELSAALKLLVDEFKLQGTPIHIALNGDYCVTRVVSGTNDKVKTELDHLEERSNLYLSLGHGKKALGGMIRSIDARHQHALLTVVNQQTLDTLFKISQDLGVRCDMVEPSLVALSRMLGHIGGDHDGPTLIVSLGEKGVEVGISQKGQLLLDYRPPGTAISERLAQVIASHMGRLQRYCDRYVGFSEGQLKSAFLCGSPENAEVVSQGFQKQHTLPVKVIDPDFGKLPWTFEGGTPGPELSAVFGTLLLHFLPVGEQKTPNLMERLQASLLEPLLPAVIRAFWPLAAALVFAVLLGGVNLYQGSRCRRAKVEADAVADEFARMEQAGKQFETAEKKLRYLQTISRRLSNPAWDELTTKIGQCLPNEVWLDKITVEKSGQLVLGGFSFTEGGVIEFEKWLNQLPLVRDVSLSQTENLTLPNGASAVSFNIKCEVVGSSEEADKKGSRNGNG